MAGVPTRAVVAAAIEAAKETEGIKRYKLGAVLFDKRRRILNVKANRRKTHPRLLAYSSYPYLHAESNVILSHGTDNCEQCDLFVLRISTSNSCLRLAKPCPSCIALIKDVGIRNVYYTDNNGEIIKL